MATDEAVALLGSLVGEIEGRAGMIGQQSDYYTGELPRLVLSDPNIPAYSQIIGQARTPWAELVIDQAAERMQVTGFRVVTPDREDSDVEADALCWDIWENSDAGTTSGTGFQTMLLHGTCALLVEAGGDGLPVLSFEHPSQAAVRYAPGGRAATAAVKRWIEDDGTDTAVLWTASGAVTFRRRGADWVAGPVQDVVNRTGVVPMFAMRNRPDLLGGYRGDLDSLYPALDRAAQSTADRITTQLYASTKVRYLIGVEPEYDEDGNPTDRTLRLATDRLLLIDSPDAKAGVFDASDLRQFIEVCRSDIAALAALSRLPTYLLSGDLVNVSREALESLSEGLVARVEKRLGWSRPALSSGMRLALRLAGDERVADPRTRVVPIFAPVIAPSVAETAQAAVALVGGGVLSASAAQDMVLHMTPTEREKAAQYMREDALNAVGVTTVRDLFQGTAAVEAPVAVEGL